MTPRTLVLTLAGMVVASTFVGCGRPTPPTGMCSKAADCTGPLPQYIIKLPDGGSAAPCWQCQSGQCAQAQCPL